MFLLAAYLAASTAAPNWRCTYPGFSDPHEEATVEFRRHGMTLADSWNTYRIVVDDPIGIVAADGEGYAEAPSGRGMVQGDVILINKRTGAFTRTALTAPLTAPARNAAGHCVQF